MNNITIIHYIRLGGSIVIGSDKPMFIVNSKGVRVVRILGEGIIRGGGQ